MSSGRLRNLFDTGSHRPGTEYAGVRGRQERTWSRVPYVSRGRSQAARCFVVGHYILHYAARKKLLFQRRYRPSPSMFVNVHRYKKRGLDVRVLGEKLLSTLHDLIDIVLFCSSARNWYVHTKQDVKQNKCQIKEIPNKDKLEIESSPIRLQIERY